MRDVVIATQPFVMLDEHGYTGTTLIEPTTAAARRRTTSTTSTSSTRYAERARHGGGDPAARLPRRRRGRDIPFRDYAPGDWDDWPPIFTPMYAMYHGAVGHTVEIPLQVNSGEYDTLPVEELRRRVGDQHRRGRGDHRGRPRRTPTRNRDRAARRPDRAVPPRLGRRAAARRSRTGSCPASARRTATPPTFPRAYVIPAGAGQRSAGRRRPAGRPPGRPRRAGDRGAGAPFALDGRRYPAGSYVVDMHQPKRGLANVMLEAGPGHLRRWCRRCTTSPAGATACCGARRSTSCADRRAAGAPRRRSTVARADRRACRAAPGRDLLLTAARRRATCARSTRCSTAASSCAGTTGGTVVVPAAARRPRP